MLYHTVSLSPAYGTAFAPQQLYQSLSRLLHMSILFHDTFLVTSTYTNFTVDYAKFMLIWMLMYPFMVAVHHCLIWSSLTQSHPPLHLILLNNHSANCLATSHIQSPLWHLHFEPSTSQEFWVLLYENSLMETLYNGLISMVTFSFGLWEV